MLLLVVVHFYHQLNFGGIDVTEDLLLNVLVLWDVILDFVLHVAWVDQDRIFLSVKEVLGVGLLPSLNRRLLHIAIVNQTRGQPEAQRLVSEKVVVFDHLEIVRKPLVARVEGDVEGL